ncbi:MAG: hypothetical protein IIB11_08540, partial [Chloroflexi bacterium]|nr:hypothetical protein [Chloroflexota bacterium]
RIVGLQLLFVQRVKVSEQTLLMIQGVDLCVDPDFQKRGVMADMRRFAWPTYYRVFDMRMGQTGRVALHKLSQREGSLLVGNEVEILVRRGGGEPETAGDRGWQVSTAPRFDERIDDFWRAASQPFRLILVRPSDHLNWRYDRRGGAFPIESATRYVAGVPTPSTSTTSGPDSFWPLSPTANKTASFWSRGSKDTEIS